MSQTSDRESVFVTFKTSLAAAVEAFVQHVLAGVADVIVDAAYSDLSEPPPERSPERGFVRDLDAEEAEEAEFVRADGSRRIESFNRPIRMYGEVELLAPVPSIEEFNSMVRSDPQRRALEEVLTRMREAAQGLNDYREEQLLDEAARAVREGRDAGARPCVVAFNPDDLAAIVDFTRTDHLGEAYISRESALDHIATQIGIWRRPVAWDALGAGEVFACEFQAALLEGLVDG